MGLKNKYNLCCDSVIVGVFEDNLLTEFASYYFESDNMTIEFISHNKDLTILDGLIKTLIFYADLAKKRYIKISKDFEVLAKYFNFQMIDEYYVLDIYSQYKNKCNCGEK